MTHWLDEYPPLRVMRKKIAAADYNRIRLALRREQIPLCLPLHGLRCMKCIMDKRAWICIDDCHNFVPILAWTGFETANRRALNAPVECELRLYHTQAGLIMGTALEAMTQAAVEHYRSSRPRHGNPVVGLKR